MLWTIAGILCMFVGFCLILLLWGVVSRIMVANDPERALSRHHPLVSMARIHSAVNFVENVGGDRNAKTAAIIVGVLVLVFLVFGVWCLI